MTSSSFRQMSDFPPNNITFAVHTLMAQSFRGLHRLHTRSAAVRLRLLQHPPRSPPAPPPPSWRSTRRRATFLPASASDSPVRRIADASGCARPACTSDLFANTASGGFFFVFFSLLRRRLRRPDERGQRDARFLHRGVALGGIHDEHHGVRVFVVALPERVRVLSLPGHVHHDELCFQRDEPLDRESSRRDVGVVVRVVRGRAVAQRVDQRRLTGVGQAYDEQTTLWVCRIVRGVCVSNEDESGAFSRRIARSRARVATAGVRAPAPASTRTFFFARPSATSRLFHSPMRSWGGTERRVRAARASLGRARSAARTRLARDVRLGSRFLARGAQLRVKQTAFRGKKATLVARIRQFAPTPPVSPRHASPKWAAITGAANATDTGCVV